MKINLLSKSLIPLIYKFYDSTIFELMIHGISLVNDSKTLIKIKRIRIILKNKNDSIYERIYEGKILRQSIKSASSSFNKLLKQPAMLSIWTSKDYTKSKKISESVNIPMESSTILGNIFLKYQDPVPSKLSIIVEYFENNHIYSVLKNINIKEYKLKNKYIFPLRGNYWACNGPSNGVSHHRQTTFQEFGYDILGLDEKMRISKNNSIKNNSDLYGYKNKIIAPASGKIVFVRDGLPENKKTGETPDLDDNRINKWGFDHAACGNVIIIEHKNKEFSLIAHCLTNSIKVKKGDKVKQGEVVALLGNSGNSTGPHLHYHLMDDADIFKGRSLPISFINIEDIPAMQKGDCDFFTQTSPAIRTKNKY